MLYYEYKNSIACSFIPAISCVFDMGIITICFILLTHIEYLKVNAQVKRFWQIIRCYEYGFTEYDDFIKMSILNIMADH